MARDLRNIIAQIRTACANPAVSTMLIQAEDILLVCDAAEGVADSDNTDSRCEHGYRLDQLCAFCKRT